MQAWATMHTDAQVAFSRCNNGEDRTTTVSYYYDHLPGTWQRVLLIDSASYFAYQSTPVLVLLLQLDYGYYS